jgi:hypothetical protein
LEQIHYRSLELNRNIFFPTTIVDGFFEQPDEVRKFALAQEYYVSDNNAYPGKRTKPLHVINPILFHGIAKKITNLFYQENIYPDFVCEATFHSVGGQYESGWIHKDSDIITALVYLTPNNYQGTSLYRKKDYFSNHSEWIADKVESYKNLTSNSDSLKNNNAMYEETMNVKGLYNRMFLFDSNIYHGAHDFFGNELDNSRLTIIAFFKKLSFNGSAFPIPRMNMNFPIGIL